MIVKVAYDIQTGLVKGYYPNPDNYRSIPEPYIEISEEKYYFLITSGKQSDQCVINGVLQEYIVPLEKRLKELKDNITFKLNTNRSNYCLTPIFYKGNYFATTQTSITALISIATFLPNMCSMAEYTTKIKSIDADGREIFQDGENIFMQKYEFKEILSLIQAREIASRNLRARKLQEINSCVALEEVEKININFS